MSNESRDTDAPLFREFEHTGDVGIEIIAPDRDQLFRRAALALASLLVDRSRVEEREEREVSVKGETDADLMHDLLAELLDVFVVDEFVWRDASVVCRDGSIKATLKGERFDADRHQFRGEIKAVTYHQLTVRQEGTDWRARIIFDI